MRTKEEKLCWEWGKESLQFENGVVFKGSLLLVHLRAAHPGKTSLTVKPQTTADIKLFIQGD